MVGQIREQDLPIVLCIPKRTPRGFCIRRTLLDDNSTKDLMVHNGANVSIGTQPEEERMQGDPIIEQLTNSKLKGKEL